MRKDYYQLIDDYINMLWDDKKRSYDQLNELDIDNLTNWLIKAEEQRFLPSLDILDPKKELLYTMTDWLEARDHDLAIDIVESLRTRIILHYKKKIQNLLDQKEQDECREEINDRYAQHERTDMYNADYRERLRGVR